MSVLDAYNIVAIRVVARCCAVLKYHVVALCGVVDFVKNDIATLIGNIAYTFHALLTNTNEVYRVDKVHAVYHFSVNFYHIRSPVVFQASFSVFFHLEGVDILAIALCVLVPLSRMYLGVHTPADVGVSIVIALILIFALAPLFEKAEKSPKVMYALLFSLTGIMLAYLLFISFWSFPEEVFHVDNVHNLISAVKNAYTLTGCMLGFLVVYTVDLKWLKFDTKAVWWAQLIKIAGGLVLVLAVKELLRAPLAAILPENTWARMIRYFLMVVTAGTLWPITFKYFAKLGGKKE